MLSKECSTEEVMNAFNSAVMTLTKATITLHKAAQLAQNAYRNALANSYTLIAQQLEKAADWMLLEREYNITDILFTKGHPEDLSSAFLQYRVDLLRQDEEIDVSTFEELFRITESITKDCFYDVMNAFAKARSNSDTLKISKIILFGSKAVWASASMMLLTDDVSRGCRNEELLYVPDGPDESFRLYNEYYFSLFNYDCVEEESRKKYLPDEFKLIHYNRSDGHVEGERIHGGFLEDGRLVACSGDESNDYIYAQVGKWIRNHFPTL